MRLCKKIKIEVSEQDAATLEWMQGKCRALYNWWIMGLRDGSKRWPGTNAAKKTLAQSRVYDPELDGVYGKLLQEVYFRLDGSPQPTRWKRKKHKHKKAPAMRRNDGIVAFDLGIKELATGYTDEGRVYHIGGFKGYRYYNQQLDTLRAKRDRCKKKSRRYIKMSKKYQQVSAKKRRKQQDCHHKAAHLIAFRLAESAIVVGDLSQRQMVIPKQENETPKERRKRKLRNRLIYNDWGLHSFMQMLAYKCERFGKALHAIDESDTSQRCHRCKRLQPMPLWKRTYRCPNCGLVMDRDENSAINIYQRFIAGLRPHTGSGSSV
jgi:IS605 OrfB family transposase